MSDATFFAGSKLAWIEQVAIDRNSSAFHVRLAVGIMRNIKADGAAILTQSKLANVIGATERGVRKGIVEMCKNGHVDVDAIGSGRGTATAYRPIIKRRNSGSAFESEKAERRSGNSEAVKAERRSTKGGTAVPPHKESFSKNPIKTPGAGAGARDNSASTDPLQVSWLAIKEGLARPGRWGPEKVEAWLDKLTPREVTDGTLVLVASAKFIANYNATHHGDVILAEWRALDPSVSRVRIEWNSATPHAQQAGDLVPATDEETAESDDPRLVFLAKLQGRQV